MRYFTEDFRYSHPQGTLIIDLLHRTTGRGIVEVLSVGIKAEWLDELSVFEPAWEFGDKSRLLLLFRCHALLSYALEFD